MSESTFKVHCHMERPTSPDFFTQPSSAILAPSAFAKHSREVVHTSVSDEAPDAAGAPEAPPQAASRGKLSGATATAMRRTRVFIPRRCSDTGESVNCRARKVSGAAVTVLHAAPTEPPIGNGNGKIAVPDFGLATSDTVMSCLNHEGLSATAPPQPAQPRAHEARHAREALRLRLRMTKCGSHNPIKQAAKPQTQARKARENKLQSREQCPLRKRAKRARTSSKAREKCPLRKRAKRASTNPDPQNAKTPRANGA